MFGEPFRTEHAAVDRMIRVAADADGAVVLDADEHPASDRAVSARRRDPPVGHLLRRDIARDGIDAVGIVLGVGVDTEQSLEVHAASLSSARYGAAMCLGTTLTKKR